LLVQVLSGPLDGYEVTLDRETLWGRQAEGPLAFPWDADLGDPQARILPRDGGWWLEPCAAPRATHCLRQESVEGPLRLQRGDILTASHTWLRVQRVE
jgi:hypothetical protein